MSRRKEKKSLLWKMGIACAVVLGIGLGSLLIGNKTVLAADPYDIIYEDQAELVGDDEKEAVLASMEPISEYANVIFYTTEEKEASTTAAVCEKVCAGYYGSSKKTPVVLFTIDMYHREIYLYCTGPTRHIIRNRDANSITDNIYRLASAKRYDDCAIGAFEQCQRLLTGSSIWRPMQRINNLFLAIILGFLLNYLYLRVARSMTVKKEKVRMTPFDTNRFKLKVSKQCIRTYTFTEAESSGSGGGEAIQRRRRLQWRRRFRRKLRRRSQLLKAIERI